MLKVEHFFQQINSLSILAEICLFQYPDSRSTMSPLLKVKTFLKTEESKNTQRGKVSNSNISILEQRVFGVVEASQMPKQNKQGTE